MGVRFLMGDLAGCAGVLCPFPGALGDCSLAFVSPLGRGPFFPGALGDCSLAFAVTKCFPLGRGTYLLMADCVGLSFSGLTFNSLRSSVCFLMVAFEYECSSRILTMSFSMRRRCLRLPDCRVVAVAALLVGSVNKHIISLTVRLTWLMTAGAD